MTQTYEFPAISGELGRSPEAAIDRNFYSRGGFVPPLSVIDGVEVQRLVEEFGSPLFVFSEHDIRAKARRAKEAFASRYKKVSFGWSYKTNYLNAVCQIFHSEGWLAEVVSDFEYEKARKLGIAGSEIIYNGPHKTRESLVRALNEGALVQIDNWDELILVESLVEKVKKPVPVGIRVWLDAGIRPIWSKFGFALANGEAAHAAARVVKNPKLSLHTLHTHIGTYILAPDAYHVATQKLAALREQIYLESDHVVPCLNLGGGFPSNSLLHGMPRPADHVIRPVEEYAEAITSVLNKLPDKKRPLLRLELGRHLVDEAGYLLTRVVALKGRDRPMPATADLSARTAKEWLLLQEDSKRGLVVDAGINLLYTAAWFEIGVWPSRLVNTQTTPTRLYGDLCMAIDVIRETVDLPMLDVGDVLTLHPVGAYNLTQSMQFIDYRPAVVLIGEDGKPELIRRRERLDDINGPELLPARLGRRG
jgi:diaminopimelate decarboxylase